ncbi:MAG TPA: hypothetical protein VF611_16160 [Pyrinomonadaceae bacterium]
MQKCYEAHRWPDSPDAVPEGEFDEFVAHAETCSYHEELMRAEEDTLLSALRPPGYLADSPAQAEATVEFGWWATHADLYTRWATSGRRVRSLVLRYRGQDVARHEWFDEVDVRVVRELEQRVRLELEPGKKCDLEIWKLPDDETDDEICLGVYQLPGFRHVGKARYLSLPTGQTVMLNVRHVHLNKYEIEFACADSEPAGRETHAPKAETPPPGWREEPSGFGPRLGGGVLPLRQIHPAAGDLDAARQYGLLPANVMTGQFIAQVSPVVGLIAAIVLCVTLPSAPLRPPATYTSAHRSAEPKAPPGATPPERQPLREAELTAEAPPTTMTPEVALKARSPVRVVHRFDRQPGYPGRARVTATEAEVRLLGTSRSANCESSEEVGGMAAAAPKPAVEAEAKVLVGEATSQTGDDLKADASSVPR